MLFDDAARTFLNEHRIGHLATADARAAPHVIPVCYALLSDAIYIVIDEKPKRTRSGLKRLRNIAANPQVALVVDDYDEDWTRLAYLLIQGEATAVDDGAQYSAALDVLRGRYSQYQTMALAIETHPMIRITPSRAHLWRATQRS